MITPELKDRILTEFVDLGMHLQTNTHEDSANYGIDSDTYRAILDQFERLGFLTQSKYLGGLIMINLTADAHDFVRLGGFFGQEELLKANIQKLGLEIDMLCKELSPNLLEKAKTIASLGASILSSLDKFVGN